MNIIEKFIEETLKQSQEQVDIHKELKKVGNDLKIFEKELKKKIKDLQCLKNEEITMTEPYDNILRELSKYFSNVRGYIKESFESYIKSLCSFSDIKENIYTLLEESNLNYNDCSPILDKKFNMLLSFNCHTMKPNIPRQDTFTKEENKEESYQPEQEERYNLDLTNSRDKSKGFSSQQKNTDSLNYTNSRMNIERSSAQNQTKEMPSFLVNDEVNHFMSDRLDVIKSHNKNYFEIINEKPIKTRRTSNDN
jgi:hypothetical protein